MSVPALRFRQDDGQDFPEWQHSTLGEVATITSGGTPSRTKLDYWNGNIPWVTTSLIDFNIIHEANEYITELGLKNSSAKVFPKNTLLMAMYGQGKTRGKVAMLGVAATTNQACAAIWLNEKVSIDFVFQNLAGRYDEIRELSNAGGQENLSGGLIKEITLSYPSLAEQTKVAKFLTAVDEKISLLTQKNDLLTQYKKGVMQQIFSQELRFKDDDGQDFPEWEDAFLGDICKITTGVSNRIDSSVDGGAYTFFDRSQDIRTSDIFLFDCEAVIVAGEGQEFIPKHFAGKFDLHQRTYAIMGFEKIQGKFLFYYVHQFRNYFLSQAVGSTVKSLRLPMFQKMPIHYLHVNEQTKIANFLTAIDNKITVTQNQLQAVKQYKQGLLQQMFV